MKEVTNSSFRREQWKMLLATMFCYLFFYTGRHNFGWANKGIADEFGLSNETMGWMGATLLITYAIGQAINGNLGDRYGARILVTLGAVLSVLMNYATSLSTTVIMVFVFWGLNGYVQSLAWAPGSRLISNWWGQNERGKAFGFYVFAAGSSSILTFLLSILIVREDMSWRWLMRLPVTLLLISGIIYYIIARNKPSDKGFKDIHDTPDYGNNKSGENWKTRYREVLSNGKFIRASLAIGFQSMARYGLLFWVPLHYLGADWKDNPDYLWITLLLPMGMAIGALTLGNVSDIIFKGNRSKPIAISMTLAAIVSLMVYFTQVNNLFLGFILLFLAGFFVYGPQASFWPLSPDLLGVKRAGTGVGIMNASAYMFAAAGGPILGRTIDITNDSSIIFLVISGICLVCVIIILTVKR